MIIKLWKVYVHVHVIKETIMSLYVFIMIHFCYLIFVFKRASSNMTKQLSLISVNAEQI